MFFFFNPTGVASEQSCTNYQIVILAHNTFVSLSRNYKKNDINAKG